MKTALGMLSMTFVFFCAVSIGSADEQEKKAPPKLAITADEKALLDQTNEERVKKGLKPLTPNPILCKVARAHSENMGKQNKMEHILDGKKPGERTKDAGYQFELCGENVGWGDIGVKNMKDWMVKDMMEWWMKSPVHRDNIWLDEYTEIGVGIAEVGGKRCFTQLFAAPFKE